MGTKLTELVGPDGSTIYVQYEAEDSEKLRAMGFFDNIAQRTEKFKETLVNTVNGYSALVFDTIQNGMKNLPRPASVKLEFGLQIGGEAGIVFITKGTTQANVKVTMKWSLNKE